MPQTEQEIRDAIDRLQRAIQTGAERVVVWDRDVKFRSLEDMKAVLEDLEDLLEPPAGVARKPKQLRFLTDKGLG